MSRGRSILGTGHARQIGHTPLRQPAMTGWCFEAPSSAVCSNPGLITAGKSPDASSADVGHGPMVSTVQASGSIGEFEQMNVLSSLPSTLLQLASSLSKVVPHNSVVDDFSAAASVWTANLGKVSEQVNSHRETAVSSPAPLQSNSILHKVLECFGKEAMQCTLSPLGFYLTNSTKDRIWRKEFIVLLSLLPLQKEYFSRAEKDKNDEDKKDQKRGRLITRFKYFQFTQVLRAKDFRSGPRDFFSMWM